MKGGTRGMISRFGRVTSHGLPKAQGGSKTRCGCQSDGHGYGHEWAASVRDPWNLGLSINYTWPSMCVTFPRGRLARSVVVSQSQISHSARFSDGLRCRTLFRDLHAGSLVTAATMRPGNGPSRIAKETELQELQGPQLATPRGAFCEDRGRPTYRTLPQQRERAACTKELSGSATPSGLGLWVKAGYSAHKFRPKSDEGRDSGFSREEVGEWTL
ncbi:hypothetical protein R1flu_020750 [Riccia fluitans]|uniref:Ribosomal protein L2 n=1 Tax=Riccia fluitans TaxID=41844 RepID=A0ABD1ZMD5_9MARC